MLARKAVQERRMQTIISDGAPTRQRQNQATNQAKAEVQRQKLEMAKRHAAQAKVEAAALVAAEAQWAVERQAQEELIVCTVATLYMLGPARF